MNSLFTRTSAWWTRYSDYQWTKTPDGQLYLLPTADATPHPYNMLTDPQRMVLDAVGVGQICMKKPPHAQSEWRRSRALSASMV